MRRRSARRSSKKLRITTGTPRLQRMYKHIYNSALAKAGPEEAARIAASTVNKYRREHGLLVGDVGRSRWYPGKKVKGRQARITQLLAEGETERARKLRRMKGRRT